MAVKKHCGFVMRSSSAISLATSLSAIPLFLSALLSLSLSSSSSSSSSSFVVAHSYLDCTNWRFNDASAYADPTRQQFDDSNGQCLGYARRYEVGVAEFGKMDEVQFFRHFDQLSVAGNPPCRSSGGGYNDGGSNEGPPGSVAPPPAAYGPNGKNIYNQPYGAMAQVQAGDTLCWRWPAKNHAGHVDDTNMVYVNWPTTAGTTPTMQAAFDAARVASISFRKLCKPGRPSTGDQTGVGSELAACGGCFTVPARTPGVYAVQWKWPFNAAIYVSMADIEVVQTAATDCVTTEFGPYSPCSSSCNNGGTQTRTRSITTPQRGTGAACPALSETRTCNTDISCTTARQDVVLYDDRLNSGWQDWSWATPTNLASTNPTRLGSVAAASFSPTAWKALFFHASPAFSATPLDVKDYPEVSFWINGGNGNSQQISLGLILNGDPVFKYTIPQSLISRGQWKQVRLVFADQGKSSGPFDGIWWQAQTGNSQPTVSIDDVVLTKLAAVAGPVTGTTAPPTLPPTPPTNFCATTSCPANSKCVNTATQANCVCYGGFAGPTCSIAPSITNVRVTNPIGIPIITFNSSRLLTVSWNSTGDIPTVSILLQPTTPVNNTMQLPIYLASQYSNSFSFPWLVPDEVPDGRYIIIVQYNNDVRAQTSEIWKVSRAEGSCVAVNCGRHGECVGGGCVCRFGWTGPKCATEPAGLSHLPASVRVQISYATYLAQPDTFTYNFARDLATVLGLISADQVEVKSVAAYNPAGSQCTVYFDIIIGGPFGNNPPLFNQGTVKAMVSVLASSLADPSSNAQLGLMTRLASDVQIDDGGTTGAPTTIAPTRPTSSTQKPGKVSAAMSTVPSVSSLMNGVGLLIVAIMMIARQH